LILAQSEGLVANPAYMNIAVNGLYENNNCVGALYHSTCIFREIILSALLKQEVFTLKSVTICGNLPKRKRCSGDVGTVSLIKLSSESTSSDDGFITRLHDVEIKTRNP
jgi:hypothetical protein